MKKLTAILDYFYGGIQYKIIIIVYINCKSVHTALFWRCEIQDNEL